MCTACACASLTHHACPLAHSLIVPTLLTNPPHQPTQQPSSPTHSVHCASAPPSLQHAVSICESHAALTAANRFSPHVRGFVRLVHAAMKHSLR